MCIRDRLAGPSVRARVNGGANPITGSVTGIGGAPANNVNLILSGPGGFDFDTFIARTASVNIPLGTFSIDNAIILSLIHIQMCIRARCEGLRQFGHRGEPSSVESTVDAGAGRCAGAGQRGGRFAADDCSPHNLCC